MAIQQPLKGQREKRYDIINNFTKGFDTKTADDALSDSTMRDVVNMSIDLKGALAKRKGMINLGITALFDEVMNKINQSNYTGPILKLDVYSSEDYLYDVPLQITSSDPSAFTNLYYQLINMADDILDYPIILGTVTTHATVYVHYDKILSFTSLEYSKEPLGNGASIETNKMLIVLGGTAPPIPNISNGVTGYYAKFFNIEYVKTMYADNKYDISLKFKIARPTVNCRINNTPEESGILVSNLSPRLYKEEVIIPALYFDSIFVCTGTDILVFKKTDPYYLHSTFDEQTIKKPYPVDVMHTGFNLLAESPFEQIDTGLSSIDEIKGVFYTLNGEPIVGVLPSNQSFNIHIMHSGASLITTPPQCRDVVKGYDEAKNPYINMIGHYDPINTSVFICDEFNQMGKFELKITKGTTVFYYTYVQFGNVSSKEVGKIEDTNKLIRSSLYCKIINNQLVLFGGHGYMFFSDFGVFNYFPSYFYLYVTKQLGDEVMSINFFREYYAIFTRREIIRMSGGFNTPEFVIAPLNEYVGCLNGNTVKQVGSNLMFLSHNGLYLLKQGYIGAASSNVVRVDSDIAGSYDKNSVLRGIVIDNRYVLCLNETTQALVYDLDLNAFYKYSYASANATRIYSSVFESKVNGLSNTILYFDLTERKMQFCDFECNSSQNITVYTDDGMPYESIFKTININFGTPTNVKKFKKVVIKGLNNGAESIPFYVTVKVDDHVVLDPLDYEVYIDEDVNYVKYRLIRESGTGFIDPYAVLGEIILGETSLEDSVTQTVEFDARYKGKSISIEISDKFNSSAFQLTNIGVEYKLKKVKPDAKLDPKKEVL